MEKANKMQPLSFEDVLKRTPSIKPKKVPLLSLQSPTGFALKRLVTLAGVENKVSEGIMTGKASDITDQDALILWDNMQCLENPHLAQMLRNRRVKEEITLKQEDDKIWKEGITFL